jgi:ABC-type glycerol-3-phosphate transport system permease component
VWSIENFASVIGEGRFGAFFWNSIVITVGGVILTTGVAAMAGYGFARLPFRGSGTLLGIILLTLTIPLAIFLVPMFLMEDAIGLLNTQLGLILPNVAIHLPFTILVMRSSFLAIPKEIEESATMDGAGQFRTWWSIMLPMARNGLVLTFIVATYTTWGEYTIAKTLAPDPKAMPLSVGLTLLKSEVWDFGVLSAVIVLAILPPIIVFVIFQKYIVAGVAQGAVKG